MAEMMLLEDTPESNVICTSDNITLETKPDFIDITIPGDRWPQFVRGRPELTIQIHADQIKWVGASDSAISRNKERLFSTDKFNCVIRDNGSLIGSAQVLIKELNLSTTGNDSIVLIGTGPFEIFTENIPNDNNWHIPTQEDVRTAERFPESNRKITDLPKGGFKIIP